jgi:hypothetical protein
MAQLELTNLKEMIMLFLFQEFLQIVDNIYKGKGKSTQQRITKKKKKKKKPKTLHRDLAKHINSMFKY